MNTFDAYWDEAFMEGDVEDLFVGSLLGGAIGDALGSFCEGWSRERILEVEDLTGGYRDRIGRDGEVKFQAGGYTDDTQQALVLVESMLACEKVDPADIAGRLLKMWRADELFGYGGAFRETLERMDRGVSWQEAASVDKISNGAVMKIAPLGLWHWQMGEEIRDDAVAVSHLTHKDPRAVAPAVAMAHVVGHLVTHRPLDVDEVIDVSEFSARPIDAATGDLIGQLRDLLKMSEADAYEAMLQIPNEARKGGSGIPGEAPATLLVALEAFLRMPEDFEQVVKRSLLAGGDVDTFAAVAGNLAGVYNGVGRLPQHLLEGLLERDRIEGLARALYQKTVGE